MYRPFLFLLCPCAFAFAGTTIEAIPDQQDVSIDWDGATDLSAITWTHDGQYFVVSNREKALIPLSLDLDKDTGRISNLEFGRKVKVKTEESDFEGLIHMADGRFFVSTEARSQIVGFDVDGDATFKVEVPAIYRETRQNKSLESLAWSEERHEMWTANEDSLNCDGPVSSREQGALVRLQKFDGDLAPAGQFAYRTEPSLIRVGNQGTGVTDMVLLASGELLVLERVLTIGFCVRIFSVDLTGATDISKVKSLKDADDVVPVKKTLLYEQFTATHNFEGMTLGPVLADGSRSMLLVADNGGEKTHHFIPLRLREEKKPAEEKKTEEKKPDEKKPEKAEKPKRRKK